MLEIWVQSDSLVSTLVLTKEAAKSEIMVYLMQVLDERPEFSKLKQCTSNQHVYGEGNPLADNGSRGDLELMASTCEQIGVKAHRLPVPSAFSQIVEKAVKFAEQLKAEVRVP
jgi:tRNA U34 2-thiouridine synthase MnmA/TrmU